MPDHRRADQLRALLDDDRVPTRLSAALAAGTHAAPEFVDVLIERCRIEPDFFVRDTLTWALPMHPVELVVPRLARELWRAENQARSQALHTLSKIGDPATWALITLDMIHDPDDQVARTAWRAAAVLVPEHEKASLAGELAREFGRGDLHLQRSLSRSLAALGTQIAPVLDKAEADADAAVRAHALVTKKLLADPDLDFEVAVEVARSVVVQSDRMVHRVPPREPGDQS